MSTKIRKAVISEFGDVSKISVVDAEIPDPPAKHVQVKVIYSGFAGADVNMRMGIYPLQRKAPLTPGYSLVGIVHKTGPGCSKFKPGDYVSCLSVYDAEAELANLPEKYVIAVPPGVDLQAACAFVLDWNTAYAMVFHEAQVSSGQRVFIHGLSGAVGYALTVLCQMQGAQVYGTASEKNHAAIKSLGATPFVYTNKDWISSIKKLGGVHAVFDALGFESWDESFSVLSPSEGGILVGYGGNLNSLTNDGPPRSIVGPVAKLLARNSLGLFTRKWTKFYYIERGRKSFVSDLQALFALHEQGKLQVKIKRVFDLEDIQEAHRSWGKAPGLGSFLVRVSDEGERRTTA